MSGLATRLEQLAETLNLLAASPLMSHQFQVVAEAAPVLVACDWLAVCIGDAAGYRAHTLFDAGGLQVSNEMLPLDSGIAGEVMRTGKPWVGGLAAAAGTTEQALADAGIHRIAVVPLSVDRALTGALYLAAFEPSAFDDDDMRLLRLLASGLATSLDGARRYQQMSDQHELMETVLACAREGIVVVGTDGLIRLANPASARLLDADMRALTGARLDEATTRDLAAIARDLPDGGVADIALPRGITAQVSRVAVTDAIGEPIGFALMLRDISLLRDLERIRAELLRSLSHDLRGPLGTLGLAAGMLNNFEALEPRHHKACEQMFSAIDYLDRLVSELSELGRLEAAGNGERSTGDLVAAIREVIDVLRPTAERRAQSLCFDGPGVLTVTADFTQLRRMAFNLVGNALKYTPDKGRVDVSLVADDGGFVLEVRDNGVGIAAQDIPRLFDRNFRVDNAATRAQPGSGLGLAIVKQVVDSHGGSITVDSNPGEGSCFRVEMPIPRDARSS